MHENVWVGQINGYGEVQAVLSTIASQKDHSFLPAPHNDLWRHAAGTVFVCWWEPWTNEKAFAVDSFLAKRGVTVTIHKPFLTYDGVQVTNNGSLRNLPMGQIDQSDYNNCHFNRRVHPCRDLTQWDKWKMNQENFTTLD